MSGIRPSIKGCACPNIVVGFREICPNERCSRTHHHLLHLKAKEGLKKVSCPVPQGKQGRPKESQRPAESASNLASHACWLGQASSPTRGTDVSAPEPAVQHEVLTETLSAPPIGQDTTTVLQEVLADKQFKLPVSLEVVAWAVRGGGGSIDGAGQATNSMRAQEHGIVLVYILKEIISFNHLL
jgi:hypothetical protein